jgi:hypothetical protein
MMDFADKVFIGSYDGFPSEGPMLKGSDSAIALRVNSQLQLPVAFLVLAYRSRADFADAASNHAHRAIRDRPALRPRATALRKLAMCDGTGAVPAVAE